MKMAKNKTAGEDMVVKEMLLELDEDILEEVALLFRDRLLNQADCTWNVWEHHVVALIPKPNKDATLIKNLRPIAVLACDLQVVQQMPGIAVRRRTTKSLGISDSIHAWTAS